MNSYKHSTYFSSESSQAWFILVSWQPYVVHVIAFGFLLAKCLQTEVHNAKFHPKVEVLSKLERVWVVWKVCSDVLLQKNLYGQKAIVFFTLKVTQLSINVQNNIQVKLSVNCISLENCEILLQGSKNWLDKFLSGFVFVVHPSCSQSAALEKSVPSHCLRRFIRQKMKVE